MTGGVTSTLTTNRILSKDKLWQEQLNMNKEFIFGVTILAHIGGWSRQGLRLDHVYSILKTVEGVGEDDKTVRLVLIRYVLSIPSCFYCLLLTLIV